MSHIVSVYCYTGSPEGRYPRAQVIVDVPDNVATEPVFYVNLVKCCTKAVRKLIEENDDEDYDFFDAEYYSVTITPVDAAGIDYDDVQVVETLFEKLKQNTY